MNRTPRSNNPSNRRGPIPGSRGWAGIRELKREVTEIGGIDAREPRHPSQQTRPSLGGRAQPGAMRSRHAGRRRLKLLVGFVAAVVVVVAARGLLAGPKSFAAPSRASLEGLSLRQRIVTIASSQVGYSTDPARSYCNKFSAYWDAGAAVCPRGGRSEEWCADFAAWAWQKAGVQVTYGYAPGEINGGAVSFYEWAVDNGAWHPATSGYVAAPGDVAVYGLSLGLDPTAAHVAIVTGDSSGQRGPDVINGDGDRTGFSVVETGTDQIRADTGHHNYALLDGYVSPP